jgi:chromosome segregation ATPase
MQLRPTVVYAGLALLVALLAFGMGRVGSELDSFRLKSSDLQFVIDDLEYQLDGLQREKEALQERVGGQNEVIKQLTHELYRANARARYAEEQERLTKRSLEKQPAKIAAE